MNAPTYNTVAWFQVLSWLTILGSGLTRRCDLRVLGSRELNLRTNPGS